MIVAALVSGLWIIDRLPRRKPLIAVTWLLSLACVYPAFRLLIAAPSAG